MPFTLSPMLWWLAAASAPLVIHLLSRRRHKRVAWAAMQYLLAALRKNSRRMRLEQWLLLAVRTLLVILVVLAVADVFRQPAGPRPVAGERTHHVLVVDGSYSMAYKPPKPGDKTRFELAKDLARRTIADGPAGDAFTLVMMGDPPEAIVAHPAEGNVVAGVVDEKLHLAHRGADLTKTLALVEELVRNAARENPGLAHREVVFYTDLGRATWQPPAAAAGGPGSLAALSESLAEQAKIVVVDVGQADWQNAAVTRLSLASPVVTLRDTARIEAELQNYGSAPLAGVLVELHVDGRRVDTKNVNLDPQGTALVAFEHRFAKAGDHVVEVHSSGDALELDNHRWLTLHVRDRLNLLCVAGSSADGDARGAARYLLAALPRASDPGEGEQEPAKVVAESGFAGLKLDGYDCVFLAGLRQVTPDDAARLYAYLQRGGGLVVFLGDQVQVENYNKLLTGLSSEGRPVLPASLVARMGPDAYALDPLDYKHPLVSPFRGQQQAGLLTTRVNTYIRTQPLAGRAARVALALANGDPLIVEQPVGRGRTVLVATAADATWSNWPLRKSYVPLVQEILHLAVRQPKRDDNVLVGQPLDVLVHSRQNQARVRVRSPARQVDGKHIEADCVARLVPDGDYGRWQYPDSGPTGGASTDRSGIYTLAFASPVDEQHVFAVNIDPRTVDTSESNLAPVDAESLERRIWGGGSSSGASSVVRQDFAHGEFATSGGDGPSHTVLLVAALALLLIETVLACYFGRRSA